MIVGLDYADDAGVYRISSDTALIQTLDFLTPVTDSPYEFGLIAAANSLSDVYAMGGEPLTAMNIVCFPVDDLPEEVLRETLAGGLEKIHEAGATLVGGHSVDDREFKYGLSVTGTVHPDRVLRNCGGRKGDLLILTKPIGTGVLSTAIKGKVADPESARLLVEISATLNRTAAEIMRRFSPSACTDITGFGLAGHVLEMASGGKKGIVIDSGAVPFIDKAVEYAMMGLLPAGSYKTREHCGQSVVIDSSVETAKADLLFDPQTSGGLLIAMNAAEAGECVRIMHDEGVQASVIGQIADDHHCGIVEIL